MSRYHPKVKPNAERGSLSHGGLRAKRRRPKRGAEEVKS